jgi:hypothetical protein
MISSRAKEKDLDRATNALTLSVLIDTPIN